MGGVTKALLVTAIAALVVAALLALELARASARADAARAVWIATDSSFRAYRDSLAVVRAARDDSVREIQREADSLRARADATARARQPTTITVERLIPTLPDSVREAVAAERASFQQEIAELRAANDSLQSIILLAGRQRADLDAELGRVNARLADAVQGWNAAERARRPGIVGRATQVLAVIGLAAITDRAVCGLTGSGLLLPCD